MKCEKCNQELKNNALFCGHCGAKTLNKLANLLRTTGFVCFIPSIIFGSMFMMLSFQMLEFLDLLVEIPRVFYIICAIVVFKNARNGEKAGFLKKMSIALLVIAIVWNIGLYILAWQGIYFLPVRFGMLISIVECIIPTLYIIFSSNIEKMYLKSKED